jgi:hypothetical protein
MTEHRGIGITRRLYLSYIFDYEVFRLQGPGLYLRPFRP